MKVSLIILFITSLFLQQFSGLFTIINYEVNKNYIAQHLCINRDKPQMHCNGKCFLKKNLQRDEKKDTPAASSHQQWEISYCDNHITYQLFVGGISQMLTDPYQEHYFSTPHFSFFHPPATAV